MLTWGLIGPGKGLEYGIEAMRHLRDLEPAPVYLIAGETHPKVLARDGERYREGLMKQAADLGIGDNVVFEDTYLDGPSLRALARSADIILLPYESRQQICSGVLVEAVSTGKPVVATAFPHAVELLSSACGSWFRTKTRRRSHAPCAGSSPTRLWPIRCEPRLASRPSGWRGPPWVASTSGCSTACCRSVRRREPPSSAARAPRAADGRHGTVRARDRCRAAPHRRMVYGRQRAWARRRQPVPGADAERLAAIYLAFLAHAHQGGGRFRLRLAYDRRWTGDPASDDANGRALFGLAVAWARGPASLRWTAGKLFGEAAAFRSEHPRAMAHAAVAAAELVRGRPRPPRGVADPHRCGAHAAAPDLRRRVALAGAAAHLRQRPAARGADRQRRGARR